jgi:hypothetical protein
MARKSVNYYLIKVMRVTGWILLPLVLLYIGTGFALCGEFGFDAWIPMRRALVVHHRLLWPMMITVGTHSLVGIYLAMRRWGWIKRRTKA